MMSDYIVFLTNKMKLTQVETKINTYDILFSISKATKFIGFTATTILPSIEKLVGLNQYIGGVNTDANKTLVVFQSQ